jgi:hypothetical protein
MRVSRMLRVGLLSAMLTGASLGATAPGVAAYGIADHPLAQLELSGNCDNAGFPLCAAPPSGVGLGGIWFWMEIDQGGWGDVSGAGCNHLNGVSGAGPIHGTFPWWWFHGGVADLQAKYPGTFVVGVDPGSDYYVVPFGFAFPVSNGHYAVNLAPGVFIQATVAP